jgi:hypothetical protein
VAGCCECGDEPSGSCATELVSYVILCVYLNLFGWKGVATFMKHFKRGAQAIKVLGSTVLAAQLIKITFMEDVTKVRQNSPLYPILIHKNPVHIVTSFSAPL